MNRYIWTAVTLLLVNVNASENPFALKENLQKIDHEQEVLLLELSKLAEARDEIDEVDDEETTIGRVEEEKELIVDEQPTKMLNVEEEYDVANAIDELVGGTEQPKAKNPTSPVETEMTEVQKAIKEAQAREEERRAVAEYEKQRAEKLAREAEIAAQEKARKEAQEREEERRAVEEYEKQRAEKLAREAEVSAQKKVAEDTQAKAAKIDLEAEKKAAKVAADAGYSKAVEEMGGESTQETSKEVVKVESSQKKTTQDTMSAEDIDVEAEKLAAKEAADAAYLAAVKEMDQEEEY